MMMNLPLQSSSNASTALSASTQQPRFTGQVSNLATSSLSDVGSLLSQNAVNDPQALLQDPSLNGVGGESSPLNVLVALVLSSILAVLNPIFGQNNPLNQLFSGSPSAQNQDEQSDFLIPQESTAPQSQASNPFSASQALASQMATEDLEDPEAEDPEADLDTLASTAASSTVPSPSSSSLSANESMNELPPEMLGSLLGGNNPQTVFTQLLSRITVLFAQLLQVLSGGSGLDGISQEMLSQAPPSSNNGLDSVAPSSASPTTSTNIPPAAASTLDSDEFEFAEDEE